MSVKHTRKRNRLPNFDYANNGIYFITICSYKREHLFGGVYNDFMCINKLGTILYERWNWLFDQYSYIKNHGFVVMPNHVHGIIEIDRGFLKINDDELKEYLIDNGRDRSRPVPTDVVSNSNITNKSNIELEKQTKILSLSNIIGAFKTTSSKIIHQKYLPRFAWQRSFHDHTCLPAGRLFVMKKNITKYINMYI